MLGKSLRVCIVASAQPVRYIRRQNPKLVLPVPKPSGKGEILSRIVAAPQSQRNPRDILQKEKLKNNGPMVDPQFEVAELKTLDKQPKQETKLLGKDIAGNIRMEKKESHSAPQNFQDSFSFGAPDLSRLGHVELAKMLRKQVLYADENLVILNKPYGLAAHDGDGVKISLRSCLPILSKMIYGLDTSKTLVMCNRLDKATTGITVCATTKDVGYEIMTLFRQQKIRRKYWAIIVGSPTPSQGVVDIPMTMRQVAARKKGRSHARMGLSPEQKVEYDSGDLIDFKPRKIQNAITHFRTLDSNEGLTFLELQPFSTVKHQLRVHTAEGLCCPILGDHKYSRSDDLSPQSLPRNVLYKYHLRKTRSRDVPMHLHLREMIIPGILENAQEPNLLISAKLSHHMFQTTKLFRLKPGAETDFKYPTRLKPKRQSKPKDPEMEELYIDPFAEEKPKKEHDVQRDSCYAVYKPRVRVKFQYKSE